MKCWADTNEECGSPISCMQHNVCQMHGKKRELVDHPGHYGGGNNPYEVIKVIFAWGLDKSFCLGNVIKYIARHEHKGTALQDLKKARWYLDEAIKQMESADQNEQH